QVGTTHGARQLTDRELIERFVTRQESAAFEALVERHGPMALRACQRALRHRHAAADAFQATVLVLARKAGPIGRPAALARGGGGGGGGRRAGCLRGGAPGVAAGAGAEGAKGGNGEAGAEAPPPADPLTEVTGRELCAALDEELQRLPRRYRVPFLLCYVEGQ